MLPTVLATRSSTKLERTLSFPHKDYPGNIPVKFERAALPGTRYDAATSRFSTTGRQYQFSASWYCPDYCVAHSTGTRLPCAATYVGLCLSTSALYLESIFALDFFILTVLESRRRCDRATKGRGLAWNQDC
eukprot:3853005-Rhodomonas_salina.1